MYILKKGMRLFSGVLIVAELAIKKILKVDKK